MMLNTTGAVFTFSERDAEYSVSFVYRHGKPSEVIVYGPGLATFLNNTDRGYKPRVEDCRRAVEDARRKMNGEPRARDAADRKLRRKAAIKPLRTLRIVD